MRRGDVFTVSLRGAAGKPRPGIVVHVDELIRADHPVLVCPLTSDVIPGLVSRPRIDPSAGNGLRVTSQAMVDRITAALPREVGRIVGRLSEADVDRLDLALMIVLGLMRYSARPQE